MFCSSYFTWSFSVCFFLKKAIKRYRVDKVKGNTETPPSWDSFYRGSWQATNMSIQNKRSSGVITGCNKRLHRAHVSPLLNLSDSLRSTSGMIIARKESLQPPSDIDICKSMSSAPGWKLVHPLHINSEFVPTSETSPEAAILCGNTDIENWCVGFSV